MKRIFTVVVVIAALAVPSIGSAGTATKQVKRTQVKRALQTAGIPELGGARIPKAPTRAKTTRSYQLVKAGSGACGTETYTIVMDGRAGIPMC
jgi:hypothetical protein